MIVVSSGIEALRVSRANWRIDVSLFGVSLGGATSDDTLDRLCAVNGHGMARPGTYVSLQPECLHAYACRTIRASRQIPVIFSVTNYY